jgi:predicted nucleic acid-binding protein
VLVLGEIRQGIELLARRDPRAAAALEKWLADLRMSYADRVLEVTLEITDEWGRLNAIRPLPTEDSLMAATAKVHGLILVTRNQTDLANIGVRVLNPFTPQP